MSSPDPIGSGSTSEESLRRRQFVERFLEDAISHSKVNDRVIPDRLKADVEALQKYGISTPEGWYASALRNDVGWITLTRDVSAFQTLNVLCEKCQGEAQKKLLRSLARKPRAPTISDVARRCLVHLSPQKYHDPNIDPWTGMDWDYFIYVGQCEKCLTIYHAQAERRVKSR